MRAGRWLRAAVLGLFMLCLAMGRSAAMALEGRDLAGIRTLTLNWSLTGQDGIGIGEREQGQERVVKFVLWGQQDGVIVENPDLNRMGICAKISLRGESWLLQGGEAVLTEDDLTGCLMDRETAKMLFGLPDPIGCTVTVDGQERIVRGVTESAQPLVMVVAAANESGLDKLTLRVPEGESTKLTSEEFASRNGLFGTWGQPEAWANGSRALSLLPAAVLVLGVILWYVRAAFSPDAGRVQFWLCIVLAGAAWFALLWLTEFSFQLPQDMIPNKWSDFDFWGQLFREKREEAFRLISSSKTLPELELIMPAIQAACWGIAGALLVPLLPKPASARELWICCALSALLAFWAAMTIDPALAHDRVLWLALPAGLIGRWGTGLYDRE